MPLVGQVGRKRPRARLAMAMLYLVLGVGALTTLYPFAIMVSTGLKGPTDQNTLDLVPAYFSDTKVLAEKYLDDKYSGNISLIAATRMGADASPEEVEEYERFLMRLPIDWWQAGFRTAPTQVTSRLSLRYQGWLRTRYRTIQDLNRAYIEENVAFQTVSPPNELLDRATWVPLPGKKLEEWREFKQTLPAEFRIPMLGQRMWQEFLRAEFQNQIERVPSLLRGEAKKFEEIAFEARLLSEGDALSPSPPGPETENTETPSSRPREEGGRGMESDLIAKFLRERLPARYRDGKTVEDLWRSQTGRAGAVLPITAYESQFVQANAPGMRREFAGRNYRYILDYILINGRAVWNTALFCLLAVLTQLIVNPLAAYALSRYPIPAAGKILLFLLATMAFPAEVAMIPSFLLLKDLGLLNTFAALVLPSAASGYMIFLLKGFFDSLPRELYESGEIDGAKETTLLWKIALPLSKPVLGYLALLAFMGAYGAFMYAFLVAQDQRMWTLMVWIYQLQAVAPKSVMMAALTLAALPTLVVFLLAQRVIMRGIVLPGER